jgi:hypothetical protein
MPDFSTDVLRIICHELRFMYDDTPTNFSLTARRYQNQKFNGQWIGRGGPTAWPLHSPDLYSLNFYSWDHLKLLGYSSHVDNVDIT